MCVLWYPQELDSVFEKLLKNAIRPIIIGGYVRDFLLHIPSKDIDVELYGIDSYEALEKLLEEFGNVNSVGKSFGICKLQLSAFEIDFSFPRLDSKIGLGHRGFSVQIDTELDFTTASRRRDFTINAIGFDVEKKVFLDPFHGQKYLQKKVLNAVDENTFTQDPLRVLRAVQMHARFAMQLSPSLLALCQKMILDGVLQELPKERIFEEMRKLFFLAPQISIGFILLEKLGSFTFFTPLGKLNHEQKQKIYFALDKFAQVQKESNKTNTSIMFALVCYYFSPPQIEEFLAHFTNDIKLIKKVLLLVAHKESLHIDKWSDYELYHLATQMNVREYLFFVSLFEKKSENLRQIEQIYKRAESLKILEHKMPNLLQGKDLIQLGLKPSQAFTKILETSYQAQMQGKITTQEEALTYCKKNLMS